MSETDFPAPEQTGWIAWYCGLQEHEFLCQVDREFILNPFNLKGLASQFNNFDECHAMILSESAPSDQDLEESAFLGLY